MIHTAPPKHHARAEPSNSTGGVISPEALSTRLSAPACLDSTTIGWRAAQLRRWRSVDPHSYPALDHHCLTLHLGRSRRIERRGEGRTTSVDVRSGALSLTPHGAAFDWCTTGPVDYAELYISPATLASLWGEAPEDAALLAPRDYLGLVDPLMAGLMIAMLDEVERGDPASHLMLDSFFSSLWLRLSRVGADGRPVRPRATAGLSLRRLQRVLDYVEAHLASELTVAVLAGVAAFSPYHFSRAFLAATGSSPHAYLTQRRIDRACRALADAHANLEEVAASCGFGCPARLARVFKRVMGTTPARYQHERLGVAAARRPPMT